jgi:allantoinase
VTTRFAIKSLRVALPSGVLPATILIDGDRIECVRSHTESAVDLAAEDFGDLVISPGVIDSHVHVNEPGRTEWEGFATATRAAAAGGVTTIVDMPLNSSPVTTSVAALRAKRKAAAGQCQIDVAFYGGLVPGSAQHVPALIDAGVCGIKAFLCDSGLDEFPAVTEYDLRQALPVLAARGVPLLVHAELSDASSTMPVKATNHRMHEQSRPRSWERSAIELLIRLCREFNAPIHIVHLADSDSLDIIRAARLEGLPLSVETCPHYLHFATEELPDSDTRYKCAPPIRSARDREKLWNALAGGAIDTIGSDHSPCPPEMKRLNNDDFAAAWGGIASLQLTLSTVWTGARRKGLSLEHLAQWLSTNSAQLVGLSTRKGQITPGFDADLVVWNPDDKWTVRASDLHHRHKISAYDGKTLWGTIRRTYVRGRLVYSDGEFSNEPTGRLIERPQQ